MFPTNREIGKSIDGYNNYELSWFGRARNTKTARILKPSSSSNGYWTVNLSKKCTAKSYSIHKPVSQEWMEN